MKHIVYISGALSDVPQEIRGVYLRFYEDIGLLVEKLGFIPYVPHLHTDPVRHKDVTPKQVDHIDRTAVTMSTLVIAVTDNPSLGVGIEVEMAYHAGKPVVLMVNLDKLRSRLISRLVRGNPAVIHEIAYSDFTNALINLEQFLQLFFKDRASSILPTILQ